MKMTNKKLQTKWTNKLYRTGIKFNDFRNKQVKIVFTEVDVNHTHHKQVIPLLLFGQCKIVTLTVFIISHYTMH